MKTEFYIPLEAPEYYEKLIITDNRGVNLDYIFDNASHQIVVYLSPNSFPFERKTFRTIIKTFEICILDKKEISILNRTNNSFYRVIPIEGIKSSIRWESFNHFDISTGFILYDSKKSEAINIQKNDPIRDNYLKKTYVFSSSMNFIEFKNNIQDCSLYVYPVQLLKKDRAYWYIMAIFCGIFVIIGSIWTIKHNIDYPKNIINILPLQSGIAMLIAVIRSWLFSEEMNELPVTNPDAYHLITGGNYSFLENIGNKIDIFIRGQLTNKYSLTLLIIIIIIIFLTIPQITLMPLGPYYDGLINWLQSKSSVSYQVIGM